MPYLAAGRAKTADHSGVWPSLDQAGMERAAAGPVINVAASRAMSNPTNGKLDIDASTP